MVPALRLSTPVQPSLAGVLGREAPRASNPFNEKNPEENGQASPIPVTPKIACSSRGGKIPAFTSDERKQQLFLSASSFLLNRAPKG